MLQIWRQLFAMLLEWQLCGHSHRWITEINIKTKAIIKTNSRFIVFVLIHHFSLFRFLSEPNNKNKQQKPTTSTLRFLFIIFYTKIVPILSTKKKNCRIINKSVRHSWGVPNFPPYFVKHILGQNCVKFIDDNSGFRIGHIIGDKLWLLMRRCLKVSELQ